MRMPAGSALVALLTVIALCGCATAPNSLEPRLAQGFKRVGVVVYTPEERPSVLDHAHMMEKSYGGVMFGAVGGFLEGVLLIAEQTGAENSSLGGSIDELRAEVPTYPIRQLVEQGLSDKLSKTYEVLGSQALRVEAPASKPTAEELKRRLDGAKQQNLDALLLVNCGYGLAAYAGETSTVAIDTSLTLYRVATGEVILKKGLSSTELFRESRTVKQASINNAELFKEDIAQASNALCTLISAEFGLEKGLVRKRAFDSIQMLFATCSNPYKLDQDCSSFWGAKRELFVDNLYMHVAGATDGKHVLLMWCNSTPSVSETTADSKISENTKWLPQEVCLNALKKKWAEKNVQVLKTTSVLDGGYIRGYFLELDGDGYSILKQFSTESK